VGKEVAEMTGMLLLAEGAALVEPLEPEAAVETVGACTGPVAAAVAVTGVPGAAAVGGWGCPLNMVNDTMVAPAATAAMMATSATTPLRDFGRGGSAEVSSEAEPSVAYDSEPAAGGSDRRGVSFATASPDFAAGASGFVRSNGSDPVEGGAPRWGWDPLTGVAEVIDVRS